MNTDQLEQLASLDLDDTTSSIALGSNHLIGDEKQSSEQHQRQRQQIKLLMRRQTNGNNQIETMTASTTFSMPLSLRVTSLWLLFGSLLLSSELVQASSSMNLPDGIENILGFVPRTNFKCERDGYFGDIDNDCRLFHLCQRQLGPGGRVEWRHWTYACGNQTMFNQLTLTCAFVDEAIPCRHASQFQYLNEVIHKPAEPFLTDADVTSGLSYYSNRIMSDGARQRAFEDSQLLAQVGGQAHQVHNQDQAPSKPTVAASSHFNSLAEDQFNHQTFQWPGANFATSQQQAESRQQQQQLHNHHQQQQQQQAHLQQNQQFVPTSQPQSVEQSQHDLIENHSFHLQHRPESLRSHQFDGGAAATNNLPTSNFNQRQQSEANAIALASSNERQTFSAPAPTTTPTTTSRQQHNNNFEPAQNTQFEYSITTNHQTNSPGDPANVIFRQQQSESSRQFEQTSPPSTTTSTTTTTTTPTAASQQSTTGIYQQASLASTTSSPTFVPTFTSSQRLQPTQVTTLVAPTTSTTTQPEAQQRPRDIVSSTTTVPAESLRQRKRTNESTTSNNNVQQQAKQVTFAPVATAAPTGVSRMRHAGFQSTRLSGKKSQRQSERAATTPIVMRKSPQTGLVQRDGANSLASSFASPLERDQVAPWSTGGDFWKRSFDSQLMAPKFESLLLRRRV